jgi:hypothetical protein
MMNTTEDASELADNLEIIVAFYTPNYTESGSLGAFLLNKFVGWYTNKPTPSVDTSNTRSFSHVELIFKRKGLDNQSDELHSLVIQSPKQRGSLATKVWRIMNYCVSSCSSYLGSAEQEETTTLNDNTIISAASDSGITLDTNTVDSTNTMAPVERLGARIEVNKPYNAKNTNYGFLGIMLKDKSVYSAMYMDAIGLCSLGESFKFNFLGQILNFLPKVCETLVQRTTKMTIPHREIDRQGATVGGFCSEIICKLLAQHVGILKDLDPARTSPNQLWYGLIEEIQSSRFARASGSKYTGIYYISMGSPLTRLTSKQRRTKAGLINKSLIDDDQE